MVSRNEDIFFLYRYQKSSWSVDGSLFGILVLFWADVALPSLYEVQTTIFAEDGRRQREIRNERFNNNKKRHTRPHLPWGSGILSARETAYRRAKKKETRSSGR